MSATQAADGIDTIDLTDVYVTRDNYAERSQDQCTDWQKSGDDDTAADWPRTGTACSHWLKPSGTGQLFCCCIMIWFFFMTAVVSVVFVAGKSREVTISALNFFFIIEQEWSVVF
jgi:hypothetical protein